MIRNITMRLPERLALSCSLSLAAAQAEARCADVGLVLAVDASGSISDADFYVQTAGYFAALNHSTVLDALRLAGTVDLAAVFWGDSAFAPQIIGWHRIKTDEDARQFARRLVTTPRVVSGNTDIGVGISAALDLFEEPGRCFERAIIDVSGDGRATAMMRRKDVQALAPARKRALDIGVVINALAIVIDDPGLGDYYTRYVAGGIGSFVMEVHGLDSFHVAIAEKLARELYSGLMDNDQAPICADPNGCMAAPG